jgi:hypothetical protein
MSSSKQKAKSNTTAPERASGGRYRHGRYQPYTEAEEARLLARKAARDLEFDNWSLDVMRSVVRELKDLYR